MNNPLLANGVAVSYNESFFIFDFRADITITNFDNSQDVEEIHEVILVPKQMIKTINGMISQNIKKYEKTFKKLSSKQDIIEIQKKGKDKQNYFG